MLIISRGLERSADAALVVAEHEQYYSTVAWPGSKFRDFFIEIWVGPTFGRNSSKVGRPSAQERKGRTFEKVLCFASGLRIQDPRIHSH